jgi:hypothetical protein
VLGGSHPLFDTLAILAHPTCSYSPIPTHKPENLNSKKLINYLNSAPGPIKNSHFLFLVLGGHQVVVIYL